jgi:hypothetical protein
MVVSYKSMSDVATLIFNTPPKQIYLMHRTATHYSPGRICRRLQRPAPAIAPTEAVMAAALGPRGDRKMPPAKAPARMVGSQKGALGTRSSRIHPDQLSDMAKRSPRHPRVLPAHDPPQLLVSHLDPTERFAYIRPPAAARIANRTAQERIKQVCMQIEHDNQR